MKQDISKPNPASELGGANRFGPEFKKKSIRSYVLRGGRMTPGQQKALERHWQQYRLSLFSGVPCSWQEVFHRSAPLVLEIGFGMGDSLLDMAINEPDKDFIGIEVYPAGAGRLVNNAVDKGVSNLKIYLADAVDVLDDCIADQCLSRAQIFFPDPWHKKKHHKRRLIQGPLVEKICSKLLVGGVLHLATDWQPYAEHMLEVLDGVAELENTEQGGGYCSSRGTRSETKFERRGLERGHGVWELVYKRSS